MTHQPFSSIAQLRQALDSKQISAVELTQEALKRAEQLSRLNIFLHLDADLSLTQARAADARIAAGTQHMLTGLPIAHKDIFVTRHWRTTAASKMLANYTSPFDATVVKLLEQAGCVSLGKLNCDEFAMGSRNENSAFGPCVNPWDEQAVPGGSSGGSAAAVAAGIVYASTGTDTGGSIRQPAALCGISAIKPTYGSVSRFGMIAFGSSLDQAGPMARSAQDLVELLDAISCFDERDSTSVSTCDGMPNQIGRVKAAFNAQVDEFNQASSSPLKGIRIGVPEEFFATGIDADVKQAVEQAIAQFHALGAECVSISLPRTSLAISAYYVLAPAEASSNLSRFDGVRYGHRASEYSGLEQMISRSRAQGFGPEVQRRIMIGTYVLSQGYYDAYYLQAQRIRRLIAQDFQTAFEKCDVIMGPVTPTVAKDLGDDKGDVTADWLADIYTLGVSMAGLPGMSVPCGFGGANGKRPIGLQIIGNYFKEGQILALADRFQQHTDWHLRLAEVK